MQPRFSLQTVLEYRENIVEALEIEMSCLLTARQQAQQILDALSAKLQGLYSQLRQTQIGEMDLVKNANLRQNIDYVDDCIEQQEQEIARLDERIEAKRQELIKAKQDEEMLENLKEKYIEAFEADIKAKEGRAQDDIYITQHFQSSARGS
jgi:flagellar FliJ protein